MLPNLIVIGAAKCGTTSLHEYLDAHPEIAMSREKELYFFIEEKNWNKGLAWYESNFDPHARVRGESSPGYTVFPLYQGVPERMAAIVPNALNACPVVILPTTSKSLCVRFTHRVLSAFRRTSSVRESLRQAVTSGPSSRTSFSFRLIATCSSSIIPPPIYGWRLYIVRAICISHAR